MQVLPENQGYGGFPRPKPKKWTWATGNPRFTPGSSWYHQVAGAGPPGGQAPGFDPFSNPYYQQMVSQVNAQGAAQAANTRGGIQQALIAFGLVPEGFQDQLGALDETTRALIQKNTDTGISGYARLLEQKKDAMKDAVNRLGARGLRRSGAKGYALRKNQLNSDRSLADSIAALLGQTSGMYGAYAQGEADRQSALAAMLAQVYGNYYTQQQQYPVLPPSGGGGGGGGGGGYGGGGGGGGYGGGPTGPGPNNPFWWNS